MKQKKTRRRISWSFVSTCSPFIITTSWFFSSNRYCWDRSWKSRERIYEWNFLASFHPLNNIEIINCFNYKPRFNGVFPRSILLRIKDEVYVINLDDKEVKEHIGFHYLLREIQLYTLTLLEISIFHKKYYTKSKINQLLATHNVFRIQDNEFILCGLYCIAFTE